MKKLLAVLGVIVAAAAPLGGALPAYAASSYDNLPVYTDSYKLKDTITSNVYTWSFFDETFGTAAGTCLNNYNPGSNTDYSRMLSDDKGRFIATTTWQNGNAIGITFTGQINTEGTIANDIYSGYFATSSNYKYIGFNFANSNGFSRHAVSFSFYMENGVMKCSAGSSQNVFGYFTRLKADDHSYLTSDGNLYYTALYANNISNDNIAIPSGYEGAGVIDGDDLEAPLHLKPEWTFISSAQWQGRFMDTNVATYDGISEFYTVCDGELAPVIIGNITNGEGWTENFTVSATAQVEVNLPESTNTQTFTITGRYDCGGFGPEFDTDGVYTFDINQYGTVNNAFMENCIDMDLLGQLNPNGLDIPQCIENIQNIIGLLSFGQIKLNKNFENIESIQCRNLQVIGGWMFKPGAYICPQVPANIRNIITPFILLALGYLAANFLRKRNESI